MIERLVSHLPISSISIFEHYKQIRMDGTSEHVYVYRPGHEKHNLNMYAEFIFIRIKLAMTEHKTASKAENGKSDALHCDPYKIIRNGAATISNYRVINDLWRYY